MKFWIGDPCYHPMFKDYDVWMDLLTKTDYFENGGQVVTFEGRQIAAISTKYGDGTYASNKGYLFPVDAGLIGFVEYKEGDDTDQGLTTLVDFGGLPTIEIDQQGTICIAGPQNVIYIYTGDDYDYGVQEDQEIEYDDEDLY